MTATLTDFTHALATEADLAEVVGAFLEMLRELAPLGHDVLPTRHNAAWFGAHVFEPALSDGDHGIVIARDNDGQLIGCTFFTPERTDLQVTPGRVIAHGIWVSPEWRGQGIALLLQDIAHASLRTLGYTQLISNVVAGNEAGLKSAQKAGAQVSGYMTTVYLGGDR
jgi:RimJ/RimL family protein N-acetyltransferase